MEIPKTLLQEIYRQAEREYPKECCGMILRAKENPAAPMRLRPCENVQDDYHKRDPENFTRTAQTAYFIAPLELLKIQKECRENAEVIDMIYHSHINAGAYFSEEDHRIACPEGEPAYPGVRYLVVSVVEGEVKDAHLFLWNEKERKYLA